MPPYDSRYIANRILDIASEKGKSLTMMQLQKLVYIAHGWWLTFSNGNPLTSDTPQAWQYGPVYQSVYNAFRGSGSRPIVTKATDPITGMEMSADITDDVTGLLRQIVDSYGDFHAYQLSDMTHQPNTPWSIASKQFGYYAPISNTLIKEHFDELRRERAQTS